MNVGAALETNAETTEVMQPGMRTFNDPAIFSKAAAMLGAALGDHRLDAAIAQRMRSFNDAAQRLRAGGTLQGMRSA